jgi:hypothetical protein
VEEIMRKRITLSAYSAFSLGTIVSGIRSEITDLLNNHLNRFLLSNAISNKICSLSKELGKSGKEIRKDIGLINVIGEKIGKINVLIIRCNRLLELHGYTFKISVLRKRNILSLLNRRVDQIPPKNYEECINENMILKMKVEIERSLNSIEGLEEHVKNKESFEGKDKLKMEYSKNMNEAINIFSIGYGKTAVLCVGRVIEGLVNKYIFRLFKTNKITKDKYAELVNGKKSSDGMNHEPKYHNKIGFLQGNRFLTEEEFVDLKAFSFKRNRGGHPDLGEIENERARTLIQQGIWIIVDLEKKLNKFWK